MVSEGRLVLLVAVKTAVRWGGDLWIMRRMEHVPRRSSDPAASCLTRGDRPWRPTSSSPPDCCPQRLTSVSTMVARGSSRTVLASLPSEMILHAGSRVASRRVRHTPPPNRAGLGATGCRPSGLIHIQQVRAISADRGWSNGPLVDTPVSSLE